MRFRPAIAALLAASLLTACAPTLYPSLNGYMDAKGLQTPTLERFPHCQDYDCAFVKQVKLNKAEWRKIQKAYGGKAKTPEAERAKIAKAVGAFEQVVGKITQTDGDRPGTFEKTGPGQLDCVDESTNTTIYMMLMQQKGWLKFHSVEQPQMRYPLVSGRGWAHQSAVVREKKSGAEYAIDSWFDESGKDARIVPMEDWLNGWSP